MEVARTAPACDAPLVVVATAQTAGRGRYDRVWLSPPAGGLYLTARLPWTSRPLTQAPNASQATALAVALLCEELGIAGTVLKWPNDVLVAESKVAGILAEMAPSPDGQALLVGLGLNVSIPSAALAVLDRPATSLAAASGRQLSETAVLERLLALWSDLDLRLETGGFAAIADDFRRFSDLEGRRFRLAGATGEEAVRVEAVRDDGGIDVVRLSDGARIAAHGGELLPP